MLKEKKWYQFLDEPMKMWVDQAYYLLDREEMSGSRFLDYGFVVFPMAKAYEGFVKKFLFETGFIDEKTYKDKHFRIGKSLNPDLPKKYQDKRWVFEKLRIWYEKTGEDSLARQMWKAWKKGRNRVFHYFAGKERRLSLEEARERVEAFERAMEKAITCQNEVDSGEEKKNNGVNEVR